MRLWTELTSTLVLIVAIVWAGASVAVLRVWTWLR